MASKGTTLSPEAAARERIDAALAAAGWVVQDVAAVNLGAARGVAIREFPLKKGHGEADYLLYADRKAVGAVEAKKEGDTLTGVETQTTKYGDGLPNLVPAWVRPLPFLYQSTGIETRFTNRLDPEPRSREVFHLHRPGTLAEWARAAAPSGTPAGLKAVAEAPAPYTVATTLRGKLRTMPPITEAGLRPRSRRCATWKSRCARTAPAR